MALPRRTLQGGTGRSSTPGGVPNFRANGTTNRYLGHNPVPHGWSQGNAWWKKLGLTPHNKGKRPGSGNPPRLGGGGHFGSGLFPGGGGPNSGMAGGGRGSSGLFPGGGGPNSGQAGGGNGGGNGGGSPSPFDPNVIDQVLNGSGDYAQLMKKLGMPLDPMFMAQRTNAVNMRDSALTQLMNQLNMGNSQLDLQSTLGNRQIDSNMAARGLFGSGVERHDERMLGNDIAQQRLGLQSDYSNNMLGTQTDYRSQMMQALYDLASRLQGQSNLPLPNTGPWAMGQQTQRRRRRG